MTFRHVIDSEKKIAWIYDEKTHPLGLENPANQAKPAVPVYDPLDKNHDGKVSAAEKKAGKKGK